MSKWGKDHWSLLGYLGTLAPDQKPIAHDKLSCNDTRRCRVGGSGHAMHNDGSRWEDKYSTRLNDGAQASGHDDWDCLNDLEAHGLAILMSRINGFFLLTDSGFAYDAELRKHKQAGGNFAGFKPEAYGLAVIDHTKVNADGEVEVEGDGGGAVGGGE